MKYQKKNLVFVSKTNNPIVSSKTGKYGLVDDLK